MQRRKNCIHIYVDTLTRAKPHCLEHVCYVHALTRLFSHASQCANFFALENGRPLLKLSSQSVNVSVQKTKDNSGYSIDQSPVDSLWLASCGGVDTGCCIHFLNVRSL